MVQEREYSDLDQKSEKWLDAGYIVMVESLGFADGS